MKKILLIICLLKTLDLLSQDSLVFANPKNLANYAFSSTTISDLSTAYLINRTLDLNEADYSRYLHNDTNLVSGINNLHLFKLLEFWDIQGILNRDSIIFPVYDHFFSLDEERPLHIPLFVTDINAVTLKPEIWNEFQSSSTSEQFPKIYANDVLNRHIETASILLDSFAYNSVFIDFNEQTYFSNQGRKVIDIILRNKEEQKHLQLGSSVDISDWLGGERFIDIEVFFDDNTSFTKRQLIEMTQRTKPKVGSNFVSSGDPVYGIGTSMAISNPGAIYSTYYACADQKMRKPFLLVAGYGPYTDNATINAAQGWPTSSWGLADKMNQEGLIEDLHTKGFDIVLVQFFPPNASVLKNSALLEKVIHIINAKKYANNSYEENIIMGFSAGALATRLTLQQMEYKHLNQNGLHPHTKLFISNDGENGGANIPLGMQHAVEYLMNYEYNITDIKIYALHYLLNDPLTKELLHYFHTATGSGSTPGQGHHPTRTTYLQYHTWNNHALNAHIPGYPSFQRNISISNGSSVPNYDFNDYSCNHYPYPSETGAIFFKETGSLMGWVNRRFEATFLKHGNHRVFYYEFKPLAQSWYVGYEAKTSNPLVLDNAPGGMLILGNPIITIINQLQSELTGAPEIATDLLFSFTPTVLTHDVKNLNEFLVNGYPDYNFKTEKLNYSHENDVSTSSPIYNNYYGYPHLGYPANHYEIVPFDALFTWDQNTEHITGDVKSNSEYVGVWSPMKPILKNFVVEEAEAWNILLQNKRIGFYARPGYTYRVDYEAQYGIYLGDHVTQKTDFIEMTSEPNAVVEAQAGYEIVFKPGVHLKAGTTFHAFIGDVACEKSMGQTEPDDNQEENEEQTTISTKKSFTTPVIYPNPNSGSFTVSWEGVSSGTSLQLSVYDLSGKHLFSVNSVVDTEIKHELAQGLYIINIQNGELWYSKRIVVE